MFIQTIVVAVVVAGCAVYAAWALLPSSARRAVAQALLRLPLPAALALRVQKVATAANACGCDGCDKGAAKAAPAAVQPIRFQPRLRR